MAFHPSKKLQKIMLQYDTTAYLYRDGVAVLETKRIAIPGTEQTKSVRIAHLHPCTLTSFHATGEGREPFTVNRLVLHDPNLIANGFERIRIHAGMLSDNAKAKGIAVTDVVFEHATGHKWIDRAIHGLMSSGVTVQPNPFEQYGYYVVEATIQEWRANVGGYNSMADAVVEYTGESEALTKAA